MIETGDDVVEIHQTMVVQGTMDVIQGRSLHIYVASQSVNRVHLPKHVVVTYAAAPLKCIVHPRGDDPDPIENSEENGALISSTCGTTPSNVTQHLTGLVEAENGIHAMHYFPAENYEAQVHGHKHVETATNKGEGDL